MIKASNQLNSNSSKHNHNFFYFTGITLWNINLSKTKQDSFKIV